jgi:hypothetical protein
MNKPSYKYLRRWGAYTSEGGMDNFFKKRVLFEWFRDCSCWGVAESEDQRKEQTHIKIYH